MELLNDGKNLAPICLFAYNRPWHACQTLESLMANDLANQSKLYIYADGPKENASEKDLNKIKQVRDVIKKKQWCKEVFIIESDKNIGLAGSIINGVTEIVNKHGKIIVLEDDLVLSRGFLKYMNEALKLYKDEKKVMHISGYMFPVQAELPETFFVNIATCWGWATWKCAWNYFESDPKKLLERINQRNNLNKFNLEGGYDWHSHLIANCKGALNTWSVRWYASFFLLDGFCLHPRISLVRNIGNDSSGVHCGKNIMFYKQEVVDSIAVNFMPIVESKKARQEIGAFFKSMRKSSLITLLLSKLFQVIKIVILKFKLIFCNFNLRMRCRFLYKKYKEFTMIPKKIFIENLILCNDFRNIKGCIVECGVWKGGMIAAMADVLGKERDYFLFDSFEGLPKTKEIDGNAAIAWQNNIQSPYYFDNCKIEMNFAEKAMQISSAEKYKIVKGWFSETLPKFNHKIAILRLDGDWYDATMECLDCLYNQVNKGGIIIIDDYYTWDGCSSAVHDFLSKNKLLDKIKQSGNGACFIIKT